MASYYIIEFMSIIFNDNSERSKLQERITADLREKQAKKSKLSDYSPKAGESADKIVNDHYQKDLKETTPLAWIWGLIIFLLVIITIWLVVK